MKIFFTFLTFLLLFSTQLRAFNKNEIDQDVITSTRFEISKIMGNIQLQRALENASKETKTIIIGRSINPISYGLLYEGALGKTMDIKAKSSLDSNLDGTIPKNPYLGKNKNKLIQLNLKIKEIKNDSTINSTDKKSLLASLEKKKNKMTEFGSQIFIPKKRGSKTLVYKKGTKFTQNPLTEYVKSTTNRDIVYVLAGINSNGKKAYYTADLDLFALLEFEASYQRDKFVENVGFVYEKMPQQIQTIQEEFTKVGFLPTSKIVNHGDEMGYGKNVTREMLINSDKTIFPMHATNSQHKYVLIKNISQLKELFKEAKDAGYGVEGWSPNAIHQRDIILKD